MKKIIAGIIIVVFIILGFTIGGFEKNQAAGSISALGIEKSLTSNAHPDMVVLDAKSTQDDPIFSLSTFITLGLVVIGIATFRRNTIA